MNLDSAYVTVALLGLQDDPISLLLGDQLLVLDTDVCPVSTIYGQK